MRRDGEVGGGLAASAAVRGATCGAEREAEAAPGAAGDLEGTSMGREGGFVSAPAGTTAGGQGGVVRWFDGRGVESPRDCVG